ncbi:MAG: hypothetical protein H6713_40635, partial [Myxococcales bacterium]|nr:hypothetical protein [Myxococcales bacterium]
MSSTTTYEDPRVVDRIERFVMRAPIVRVRTVLYVHERYDDGEEGPPCPCCSSRVCHVVQEIDDLDLMIDRFRGIRVARWRLDPEDQAEYDEIAQGDDVEELVIPLRCSRKQLDIILCDARLVIVTGGSRAGKTQVSQIWLLRRILRDGGPGSLFWILGPDLRAAWLAHAKMIWGTSTADPVLPADRESGDPLLCRRWPDRDRGQQAKDKRTLFLDGSTLDLRPLDRNDASRIRGEAISAGVVEEASAVKSSENLIDASNRVVDTGGSILMSTTPDDNEFLEECIASAHDEERNAVEEPRTVHFELSRYDNPWLTTASVDKDVEDLRKKAGQAAVDRQILGKWVPRGNARQHVHFDFDCHVLPTRQNLDIEVWTDPTTGEGFLDVTKAAIKKLLPPRNPLRRGHQASNFAYIGGLDVNKRPITLIVAKIFARELQ